ncbi:MAG: DUF5689 domain-containing protein [Alistipes finegoldii]|uniref:DUF5689 domain-containing protein n=1 Tax=Alistipes finegoldii TaxID=214856 RepID=UPI00399FC8AD
MKKLNLLRLLFGAMFLIAATAFTSCVDDNDDDGMPYLEVAPEALTFSAEGVAEGASAVTVKSNRPWTLAFESGADWVTPSATDGKAGTTEVEFSIPASNESRTATLSFQLKNSYGAYFTKTVTINQGEVVPEKLVYKETFGTTGDKTPVASYDGWDKTGEGSSTVTYAGEGVDIRSNLSSVGNGSAYEGSGGSNLMFGTGNTYFTVQDITLPQGQTGYTLTFGASYFNAPNIEIYDQLTVQFSKDGEKWTNAIPYTFENFVAEKNWNLATLNFTLKEFSEHLYIKFLSTKKPDGNYRIDDVTLVTSAGGQQVDLGGGAATPAVTTANASNVAETTVTLGGSIANADLADYSAVGVEYVVFATGNTPDWTGSVKVPAATKAATWTVDVTGLTKETQYAFRAYATPNTGDILYGDHKTFVTTGGSGGATTITIPELLAKITATSAAEVIDENVTYTFEGVICGDPKAGNASFGTLYVMTPGATTGGNGISLYNSVFWSEGDYKLGDKVLVTLTAGVAKGQIRNSIPQVSEIGTGEVIVQSSGNAVTPIKVNSVADISNYFNMPVTIEATTSAAGMWMDSGANTTRTLTAGGANLAVYLNKNAWTTFKDQPYIATTAEITGIGAVYSGQNQILPRNLDDVKNFKSTAPMIIDVTPSSLSWASDDTAEKTVTIEGVNFNGFTLSSLTSFNASVEGTTVKISPKAVNTSDAELKETLTITANGGNSVTVTLTQNGASSGTKLTITITPTTADSGFPATAPTTEATATIDGYVWGLLNAKQNAGYLMINGTNGYLATPAVPGSTLKTIKITTSNGISASAKVTIKDTSDNIVSPEQAVGDKNTEYTFNLTNPAAGVSYRINSSNKNTQLVKVELSYE